MTDIRLLYVTTKDLSEAQSIADTLLERRLIACANIFPTMHSVYRWNGSVQHDSEAVLILKTSAALAQQVTEAVTELHSYATPCVLSLPVESGASGYLNWLKGEL
jgi:periplasmic divalent cation tolerance protein